MSIIFTLTNKGFGIIRQKRTPEIRRIADEVKNQAVNIDIMNFLCPKTNSDLENR